MDASAGVASVAIGLSVCCRPGCRHSLNPPSAGTHEDDTVASAIEYILLWVEAKGNQVGDVLLNLLISSFRHDGRTSLSKPHSLLQLGFLNF